MAWIGADDTDRAHQQYGGPLFLVQNSWGGTWNDGPKKHDQPDGSFWIRPQIAESMIRGGGGLSVRGFNRTLDYDMRPSTRLNYQRARTAETARNVARTRGVVFGPLPKVRNRPALCRASRACLRRQRTH